MAVSPFMACFDYAAASGLRWSGGFTAEHGATMLASAIQMSLRLRRHREVDAGSRRKGASARQGVVGLAGDFAMVLAGGVERLETITS
ncbi:hypothetical protein JOS77_13775 [Chromobacterium haemolyticum]|nr:hypothetical protein JOS77_13775 [Chromobacterium haemolyticum]